MLVVYLHSFVLNMGVLLVLSDHMREDFHLSFLCFLSVDMSQLELFELYPGNVCVLFAGKACTLHDFINSVVYT